MHSMYSLAWKKHRVALQGTAPILKTLLWSIPGPPTHVKPPHNQDKKLLQLKNKENVDFLPQNWAACGFSPRRHSGWPCGLFQANHPRGSENSRLLVRISGSNSSKTAWDPQVPLTCLCLYLAVFQWNVCKMLQVYILKHLEPILILRVHQRTNPPEVVAKVHPNQVHVQRSAPPALSSQSQLGTSWWPNLTPWLAASQTNIQNLHFHSRISCRIWTFSEFWRMLTLSQLECIYNHQHDLQHAIVFQCQQRFCTADPGHIPFLAPRSRSALL